MTRNTSKAMQTFDSRSVFVRGMIRNSTRFFSRGYGLGYMKDICNEASLFLIPPTGSGLMYVRAVLKTGSL
jgi:hypothetical protein